MLKANIEAQIDYKRNERQKVLNEIREIDSIIRRLKAKERQLLVTDSDLYYDIEKLREQLND